MMISAVSPENCRAAWASLKAFVEPALDHDHNDTTSGDVLRAIEQGEMLLLCVMGDDGSILAVQTCEVVENEKGEKILNLVTTAGHNIEVWQDSLAEKLDEVAEGLGCGYIHTRGRLGWLRRLKRNGYEPLYFVAEKRVRKDGV